ncbi:PfkB family carbohydrate kinase [Marisediminicola sp. LYQ134]|uniref:PfkB family carbohydrate kinase n=1 Tax=unclassified Marisediminicola TaxID=2618316 RepID=UPI0039838ED5
MTVALTGALLAIGETMAVVTPAVDGGVRTAETFLVDAGGAESNVAAHVAAAGGEARWFSRLGDDALGARILDQLTRRGVDTRGVIIDREHPTGLYVKDPGAPVRYYRAGSAASTLSAADARGLDFEGVAVMHISGITLALSASAAEFLDEVIVRARDAGVFVSVDVNHRPALWGARDAAGALEALARRADALLVGRDEAESLWGDSTASEIRARFAEVPQVIVKDAHVGASAHIGDDVFFVPSERVDVVDAVGAGDAFAGGYLAALLAGAPPSDRLRAGHARAATTLRTRGDSIDEPRTDRDSTDRDSRDRDSPTKGTTMSTEFFDEAFAGAPIMAILRGMGLERSVRLATTAWDLGIDAVEVPLQTDEDERALREVVRLGALRGKLVGAGTILTTDQVDRAAECGAAYLVSPGTDPEIVRAAQKRGIPILPGVATPSEVQAAVALGLTWMKAFPAEWLGAGWFRHMRGPFPHVRFVATGGLDARNVTTFLEAGVRVAAVGSALEDASQLDALAAVITESRGMAQR